MASMSWSLDQLLQQLVDPEKVHFADEAYDLALARGLSGPERDLYVGRLVDAGREGDGRAILTLGYIQAVETLPALVALAKTSDPLAPYARRAVGMMGKGAEIAAELVLNVLGAPRTTDRIESIKLLAEIDAPLVRPTLEHAIGDVDWSVRSAAWEALVTVYGLRPLIAGPDGQRASTTHLELGNALLASDIEPFARMGIQELQWVFRRLDAGVTPAALGIAYVAEQPGVFDALRSVLFDEDQPFPLAEIAQLTGISRRYAELMVAMRLEHEDRRAAPALLELGALWTLPGLVEYGKDHDVAAEIAGLEALGRTGWLLAFERPESTDLAAIEGAVSRAVGPPTVLVGELSGNPRDFYARTISVTAHDPEAEVHLALNVLETTMGDGDPAPHHSINGAHLFVRGRSADAQTAAYHAIRDELAELGFTARVLLRPSVD